MARFTDETKERVKQAADIAAFAALYGQVDRPVRLEVRHADPYLLVALLTGQEVRWPEISTAAQ